MLKRLATAAVTAGLTLEAEYDMESDYTGTDVNAFMEAMNACDEMRAVFYDKNNICRGWARYIPGLDAGEQIVDHDSNGFVNAFLNGSN